MIEPDQIYRYCDPHAPHIRLRIMTVSPHRAEVFYLHTGRRGEILLNALHDSAVTKTGKPRRTGYALEQQ
jgi:hypothetical protein